MNSNLLLTIRINSLINLFAKNHILNFNKIFEQIYCFIYLIFKYDYI